SGLCRYVDHELACYTRQDGLVSDEVMSLAEDQQGRLWIGTPSGLSCFEDRHFTNFTAASGALPSNNIISLHAAADGRVWVGTDGGLRLLRDPTSTPEDPHLPVLQVTALASAADGRIWAHSKGGRLWGMVGANWQEVFLRKRRIPIAAMEVDDAGELWAVSMPAGGASIVLRYDGQHATNLAPGSGLGNRLVHDLLQDREGNMWLASSAGLHRYDAGHFSRLGRAQGLASNVVTRLLPNADGGLWIGTQRGLSRLDVAGRTVTYGDADGLSMRPAVALAYGVDGKLWVATPVGLARGDSAGFQPVTLEDGSAVQQIRSLAADSRGGMWMARGESGVLHIDAAGKSSHFTTSNSLANAAAMSVATDGDTVWIGTITGLNRLVDGVMTSYDAEHGVPQVTIHDLLVDSHARLWLATDAGLVMYDRRRFETFTATDGVGSDFITTLMEDRDGVLWIGTRTGLSRFDGAHFQSLLARDGLPDDTIQAVAQDAQGDIWVATPAGAVRYRLRREAPLIHVTNVTTDVDHGTANKIHMPSSQQRVEFKFRASSFKTRPEALLFRYRLRPLEPEWRQTRLRSVSYEGLPRDTYTFEVEVIDRDLTRSQMPAQVTLEVHLPYADIAQWSIFALVALAGILLAGQLWRRSAERKERDRRELVLQKMRETIWTLDSSSQVDDILAALQQVLGDVGVPYMACGVNIIDAGSEPRVVYHNLVEGVWSSAEMQPQSARNVAGFRRRGEVVYRRDLRGEDTYQDTRQNVGEANTRRSVIDLPFSHGTLAFNSDRPNAFDGYQPYLEAIGEVLSEAFHRFDDLQALRDRTQRAEVAQEGMRVAKEEAEQANQSKSTFLANMSHEIRTPMNSILGFSDILAGTIEDGQQREFLNAIQASGKSLLGLINDILDLSKVEAGKLELEPGPCDLAAVCHEMEQVFAQKSAEKGVDLVIDVPSDFPDGVILDELRIRQVLINLLGNAIKFTENGTVRLTATAKVDDDHADLCLAVSDTGVGIPADQIDKVFGAFEQQEGQSAAKFGGTGLGLAISRRLSQMMGGDIVVTSEMGKGSTFSVELTRQPVVTRATLATAVAVETVPDVSFRSSSVLVVDDVASNRLLVKTLLIRRGVEVIEAEDGAEALRLAESMRPDLILMDLRMPVMDGLEATRRLRQDETLKAMPVIALTASAMRTAEGGIREVCDGYLAKPVTEVQLVRALMEFLPYDEADATEADAPVDKPAHEWSLQDMPGAARDALPELVSLLDSEQDAWEELSSTLTINDVETFASRMQEMGHRYGFVPLADWAERLAAQASAFDMAAMPETLREYADISATLRAMTR
ncbi:MAG: response regulator, partial [Gemmatimonadetes bacterium]|nr:response regulator [Gemmatimonadota bacterium]